MQPDIIRSKVWDRKGKKNIEEKADGVLRLEGSSPESNYDCSKGGLSKLWSNKL
jgi:hypothetical protein